MTSIPDARIHFLVESAGLDGGMRGWTVDARAIADGRESLAHQEVAEREMDTFGTTLRRLRLMAGLTQEELAERAQLSERALRRLESNGTTARLQSVRLLAEALELSTDERAGLLLAARTTSSDRGVAGRRYGPARFLTPLIGREEDLAILKLLLDERRLVTVRGTGGVGKTRLAEAVAEQLTQAFDRVGFVDLAPLREPAGVLGAIAGTLSIRQQGSTPLIDVVVAALGSGRTLLVLDNLEHLLPARDTVLELLGACPGLSILATSWEALRVRGERVYTLGPLRLPAREEDVFRSPAIRLFLERARDAGAMLKLDEVTTKAAVEICRRLDGLPLAIELVAVRTAVLSPPVLLDRLSARLLTLEHQARDVPARQRTIHSTIAWSFDLLTPAEKALFRRLAVFSDGWTVDAADAVCQGGGGLELATLEGLTSLAEKSLLTVQDTPEERQEPRFGMVETVREFALEHLMASSETEDAYRNHALYFLRLATEAEWALSGPEQALWLERLEREHDNLRVVLRRAQQTDDVALGLALAGRLWPFWLARTHFEEAQVWLDTFLPRADAAGVTSAIRARAGYAFAALVGLRGDNERGISLLRHALHLARQAGEDAAAAETLRLLGVTEQALGHYSRAEELFGEGLGVYQRLGNQAGTCAVLSALAGVAPLPR